MLCAPWICSFHGFLSQQLNAVFVITPLGISITLLPVKYYGLLWSWTLWSLWVPSSLRYLMIFAWISHRNANDDSICVCAQCCVYSFCSLVFLAAGIPCLPHLAHTRGLCWLFTEAATRLGILSPVYGALLSLSIPGTKGQSCLLLPLLSPCPGSYCCPSLATLPKSGSSSLRAKPHRALLFLPLFTAVSPCP